MRREEQVLELIAAIEGMTAYVRQGERHKTMLYVIEFLDALTLRLQADPESSSAQRTRSLLDGLGWLHNANLADAPPDELVRGVCQLATAVLDSSNDDPFEVGD